MIWELFCAGSRQPNSALQPDTSINKQGGGSGGGGGGGGGGDGGCDGDGDDRIFISFQPGFGAETVAAYEGGRWVVVMVVVALAFRGMAVGRDCGSRLGEIVTTR